MQRLKEYTREALEALPVAGKPEETPLRGILKAEFAAGNLQPEYLTTWGIPLDRFGVWVAACKKSEAVSILLGEAGQMSATTAFAAGKAAGEAANAATGQAGEARTVQAEPEKVGAPKMTPAGQDGGLHSMAAMLAPYLAQMGIGGVSPEQIKAAADAATKDAKDAVVEMAQKGGEMVQASLSAIDAKIEAFKADVWAARPVEYRILPPQGAPREIGKQHKTFPELLELVCAGLNVWLVGPAGSGKTTAAEKVAEALALPFEFNGAIDSEHKLLGFVDAQGRIVSRPFRRCWEQGGVYLFDEVDASLPAALLAFNAALSNGYCDFPDGKVTKHPDFRCIAGGNVWNGATAEYCGRMKQDAAFLDRFQQLEWAYDEALEKEIAGAKAAQAADGIARAKEGATDASIEAAAKAAVKLADVWTAKVQGMRAKAKQHGLRIVISPRASIAGAVLLARGVLTKEAIERVTIRKGLDDATWKKLTE